MKRVFRHFGEISPSSASTREKCPRTPIALSNLAAYLFKCPKHKNAHRAHAASQNLRPDYRYGVARGRAIPARFQYDWQARLHQTEATLTVCTCYRAK